MTESDQPSAESVRKAPWEPVSKLAGRQGLAMALFGPPGAGKSTFGASATTTPIGRELLIVNFDGELKSLEDRSDLMVWPRSDTPDHGVIRSWQQYSSFATQLRSRKHPFKVIQFDTINAMYELAYRHVIASGLGGRDGRAQFGAANDLVLGDIGAWCVYAREKSVNVLFIAHSEEHKDGENGPLVIRMSVTPGTVKGIMQKVSTVGCLLEIGTTRKLYLHNTAKIIAKHHQPQSGDRLPLEITNPDFGKILEHVHGVKPYPRPEKKK
jgi:hypothetical protein